MTILIFSVNKCIYGMNIDQVQEIIVNQNSRISRTIRGEFTEGVVDVRDSIYTVMNMESIFGSQKSETEGYLILCSEDKLAFKVDNVLTIVSEENLEIKPMDNISKIIENNMFDTAFQYEDHIGLLIDSNKLMKKIRREEEPIEESEEIEEK